MQEVGTKMTNVQQKYKEIIGKRVLPPKVPVEPAEILVRE